MNKKQQVVLINHTLRAMRDCEDSLRRHQLWRELEGLREEHLDLNAKDVAKKVGFDLDHLPR